MRLPLPKCYALSRIGLPMVCGLFLTVVLSSCRREPTASAPQGTNPSSASNCQTITHNAGETKVCGKPQKVVTLGPNLLELLLTFGIQPIGHAEYFPFPTQRFDQPSQQIPYLGERLTGQPRNVGTAESPSLDAIAKLQPDLILGDSIKNKDEYELLSKIAPTLLYDYGGANGDWQSDLQTLGKALQQSSKAESAISNSQQRLDKLKQDLQKVATQQPRVLLLQSEQVSQGVRLETANSACGALLEEVEFQVVVPPKLRESNQDSHVISLESLTNLETDWILIQGYTSDMTTEAKTPEERQLQVVRKTWDENAIVQSLPASKKGKVYFTTVYLCHALLGPIGTEIFLSDLHQQLSPSVIKASSDSTRF